MVEPTESWDRLQALFDEAVERDTAERAAFVAQACGDDAELKTRLGHLLAAYEQAGAALEASTTSRTLRAKVLSQVGPRMPSQIGRFAIKRSLPRAGWARCTRRYRSSPVARLR